MAAVEAVVEAGLEQAGDVGGIDRTEADAALRRLDFDQRLQPQQAAGAVADDLDVESAPGGFGAESQGT
jgi:hypothetical protein